MDLRPKHRAETIKLLEENIGIPLFDINCSNINFDPPPRVMKIKINKWDLINLKIFCTAKETIKNEVAKVLEFQLWHQSFQ